MRTMIVFLLVAGLLAGGGYLVARAFKPQSVDVPTVTVQRGEFLVQTRCKGDLRAVKNGMVNAPNLGGGLVITTLAALGDSVKKDEVVLAFDPSEQENILETSKSTLDEAEQQIRKIEADAAIRAHTDQVDLLKAEFAVRRAELEVSRNELASQIDAQKNLLTQEAARKKLAQLRQDIDSRQKSGQAELAVAREKSNKASLDVKQTQMRLDQITVKSPMDGLVNIRQNRFATGGFFTTGMEIPDYRMGDQTFGGDTVLEVVDTEQMEVGGKIYEADRSNLKEGQEVFIRPDSIPGLTLKGKIKMLAGTTSMGFFSSDPNKTFDVAFALQDQEPRLRPGMSTEVEIITERAANIVHVPQQAVFDKENKRWVFVKNGARFDRREVTVGRRGESQLEITKGLSGGEIVALLDMESRSSSQKKTRNPLAAGPGK